MTNPFASSPFAAATETAAAPTAPVAETVVTTPVETVTTAPVEGAVTTEVVPVAEGTEAVPVKKPRKPRTSTNRRKTPEEVKYILANYKDQSTSEIARHLKLTPQQVSRTVLDARKSYNEKAETLPPEQAEKIRNWIETYLPSKASEFGKGGTKRGTMVDNIFDDIFGDLL